MPDDRQSAQPKCPVCGVVGIEHFKSTRSNQTSQAKEPWFFVIHCDQCGYVYNVLAKHIFTQNSTRVVLSDKNY